MSLALQNPVTIEDFLDWERAQERPYEFDGIGAVAMNGGTLEHQTISFNAASVLAQLVKGSDLQMFQAGAKVIVAGRVRYPDVIVGASNAPVGADIVPDPVIVVEVLSPSTSGTDRIKKNEEYRQTPSIQHYVILEQSSQAATVFSRRGEEWLGVLLTGNATLDLPAIGAQIPLAEIYDRVRFPEA